MKSTNMKGLSVFIADIRNCRSREAEEKRINKELANIRAKFKDGSMSGYDRKKYVCKLMYMYILGWNVDFGHVEAANLITSIKYSEKQVGYLAVTLLFNENSDMARLIINSMAKDLSDRNEVNNCLVLNAIANIGSREMAEVLGLEVYKLLSSNSTTPFVKKKAALCLLRLFKKSPEVMPVTDWSDGIIDTLGHPDYGVVTSTASLIIEVSRQHPAEYRPSVHRAVDKLHAIIVAREPAPNYLYYKVPLPWLQVKLLRLLQQYPPFPENDPYRQKLETIIRTVYSTTAEAQKNANHNNAQNAILFEVINLAIHIDPDGTLVKEAASILSKFLTSKEPNMRYLALQAFAYLANYIDSLDVIKREQETILMALKDKDVSVRRQALDLLYAMCDVSNARTVVTELLRQLQVSDEAIKEEMVLKIAILAEKFAPDYSWYLDTILQIIATAGEYTSDDIWYRIVQIVSNQPDLQTYATKSVYTSLRNAVCHESTVKIAAYLIGEYGHYNTDVTPLDMLQALHAQFNYASQTTRALLFTTYFKMVNLFPEIKPQVVTILQGFGSSLDVELQNRATEYLIILAQPTTSLLELLCEEMPPFPIRASPLEERLARKKEDSPHRSETLARAQRQTPSSGTSMISNSSLPTMTSDARPASMSSPSPIEDLLGLNLTYQSPTIAAPSMSISQQQQILLPRGGGYDSLFGTPAAALSPPPRSISPGSSYTLAPDSEKCFTKFYYDTDGVLYEDASLQIGVKSKFQAELGAISFYLGNKTRASLSEFRISVQPLGALQLAISSSFGGIIAPGQQAQHIINVQLMNCNLQSPPLIHLSFTPSQPIQSSPNVILQLPLLITKFITPHAEDGNIYMSKWNTLGASCEVKLIVDVPERVLMNVEWYKSVLRQNWSIIEGMDKPENVIASGLLRTVESGLVECYLRVQTNNAIRKYCVTTRSINQILNQAIIDAMSKVLLNTPAH